MTDLYPDLEPINVLPPYDRLLTEPHTIADIRGGRYSGKSESVHRIAVWRAMNEPLRCIGARETLQSTKDSSHKTISDILYGHGMARSQNGPFEILQDRILRKDGERVISEFFFIGVRESIRDKKSIANIDLVVFDEAGKCSEDTLNVFLPTIIRRAGCKAWFIWNPESTADPIHKWLSGNPGPSNCIHIDTTYKDNPFLSDEARRLIEDCKRDDYDLYEHLYLGKPISSVKGAIFKGEMEAAKDRIKTVPYNRKYPVHTFWDLGMDGTVIWFVQCYEGQLWFIDFYWNQDQDIAHYLIELQDRKSQHQYLYGNDYLPHDALSRVTHGRGMLNRNPDMTATIDRLMRDAGRNVVVCAVNLKIEQINMARTKFPLCHFDALKCAKGIEALRNYQWDRELTDDGKRKPLHNLASHPADAFMQACINARENIKRPVPIASTGRATAEI